ncbi:MAG: hypothetical protein JRD89_04905 [Deltaproteobacteria bacterium]|nr:hypothetical protein [Deltaproteobacteria bacterium]
MKARIELELAGLDTIQLKDLLEHVESIVESMDGQIVKETREVLRELPPRGTGLERGTAREERGEGEPLTEEERAARHEEVVESEEAQQHENII